MEIKYIFGNNKTQKTTKIAEIAKEFQKNNEKCVVIVPEQMNLLTEKFLLEELNSILNIQVYSFLRLSNRVFQDISIRGLVNLDETGKIMLLKLIANRKENEFKYYKKNVFKTGFIEELSEFISEFFKSNVTLDEINGLINNSELSEVLRLKLHDIKIILDEYSVFLESKFISSDDSLDLLTTRISKSTYLKNINVIIDGFYGLTEQEYKVINELVKHIKSLTITFNINSSKEIAYFSNLNKFDPYFEPKKMCNKITDILNNNNLKVNNIILVKDLENQKPDLFHLKNNYLKVKSPEIFLEKTDNIELLYAKNKVQEVETIAKKIVDYKNNGYLFSDIKVICGDINEYKSVASGIFDLYEIPYFIDEKDNINNNSLIKLVNAFLYIVCADFSFDSVMNLLKIDLYNEDKMSDLEVEIFENYLLEYGIKGFQFKNEFTYGSSNKKYMLEEINNIRVKIIDSISSFSYELKLNKKYNIRELAKRTVNFLEYNDITIKIENIIENASKNNDLKRKQEYEQIWDKFINVIEKVVDILGEENVTIKQYSEIISQGLEATKLGMIPLAIDEVTVGDYQRSKLSKSKVVFLIGVKDDSFPVRPKESSVLLDQEKDLINKHVEKIQTVKDVFLKQNLLIYDCIVTSSEKLIVSYPYYTFTGGINNESIVMKKLNTIFPNISHTNISDVIITNKKTMVTYLCVLLKKHKMNIGLTQNENEFINTYLNDELYKNKIEILNKVIDGYKPEQILSKNAINSLYYNKMDTSISRLEKYAKCPFSYFLEYNLKLKDREIFEVMSVDIGVVFHDILDRFLKYVDNNGLEFSELDEDIINQIVDNILNNLTTQEIMLIFRSSARYAHYLERIKEISKKSIFALSKQLSYGEFKVYDTEFQFGRDYVSKIVFELNNGKKIELSGVVDRIDIYEEDNKRYIKVIDFKSSRKEYDENEVIFGTQIQLLTYLDVLIKKGNDIFNSDKSYTYLPGGVYYFELKNPKLNELITNDPEEIKKNLLKEFMLNGVTNADISVVNKIDKHIEETRKSDIIKVTLKNDNSFYKYSSVYTEEEFRDIREKVNSKIEELGSEIFDGKIDINYEQSEFLRGCNYCNFSAICKRDKPIK